MTREEILANAETYRRQVFRILDPGKTEIRFNSEWLSGLGSEGFVRLASHYNVARMLERRDFRARFEAGLPIALHEFLYPLAQAYDSVVLRADVELGGTDQLFNLNVGRDLMPAYGLEPQVVMTVPLLEGLDGVEKMSKSLGNYVAVEDPPREMFGKLMSISDELMWRYYELCTGISAEALAEMKQLVASKKLHPKQAKEGLALRLVADFHGEEEARRAREEFERVFARKGLPDEIPQHEVAAPEGKLSLPRLLVRLGLAASTSEAVRLIRQGGVRVDGASVPPDTREIEAPPGATRLLKVGKRRFARVTFTAESDHQRTETR
jgi:tyrosyl-tRNA synthetase